MSQPTTSPRKSLAALLPAVVIAVAFLAASVITWRTSSALFTASTVNPTDTFATGTVALSDNDSNSALFTVTNMKPGDTASRCIRVTYTGTLASSVKVYGQNLTVSGGSLDQYLLIQIEQGTNSLSTAGVCGTFTSPTTVFGSAALSTFGTAYASGSGNWTPSSNPTVMDYRVTYTLSASAPNGTQGQNLSLDFVWEAQNT